MKCIFCGKTLPDGCEWCNYCGAPQHIVSEQHSENEIVNTSKTENTAAANEKPPKKHKSLIITVISVCSVLVAIILIYTFLYINITNKFSSPISNLKLQEHSLSNYSDASGYKLNGFGYSLVSKDNLKLSRKSKINKIYRNTSNEIIMMQSGENFSNNLMKNISDFNKKYKMHVKTWFDFLYLCESTDKNNFSYFNLGKTRMTAALLTAKETITPKCSNMYLIKNDQIRGFLFYDSQNNSAFQFFNNKDLNTEYTIAFGKVGNLDHIIKLIETIKFN